MKTLIITLICLFFITCKKDKETVRIGKVTFYQSDYKTNNVYLYFDNSIVYNLIANDSIPKCGEYWNGKFLTVERQYGWHTYFVRDIATKKSSDTFNIYVTYPCQIQKVPK